jgi:hypothetical protein
MFSNILAIWWQSVLLVEETRVQIPPSVSTIKHSGRKESFVRLHTDKCPTIVRQMSDQILPGLSESLHSQIVKL